MSRIIDIVVHEVPESLNGLEEQFVTFAGERTATDPRTFLFDGQIELTLRPTAAHVLSRVIEKLGANAESLVLDEALVLEWASRRLNVSVKGVLRKLLTTMPSPFAVAIELGIGMGVKTTNSPASLTFDIVDPLVRGETSHDLTIVLVDGE